jgi:hypothetical protein
MNYQIGTMLPGLGSGLIEKIIHKNGKQLHFNGQARILNLLLFAGNTPREFVDFLTILLRKLAHFVCKKSIEFG